MTNELCSLPPPVREARILEELLDAATVELPGSGLLVGALGLPGDYAAQAIALGAPSPPAPPPAAVQMRSQYYSFGEYTPAHTTIDHQLILRDGLGGFIARVEMALPDAVGPARDTLAGMRIALCAVRSWIERHRDEARRQAEQAFGDERCRLQRIGETCTHIACHPPRSFHEALQLILFVRMAVGLSERCTASLSLGRLDQDLLPLYRQDLARGTAAAVLADLLAEFVTHLNHFADPSCAVNLGGLDEAGRDQFNELSELIVKTAIRLRQPSPLLVARVHPGLPSAAFDLLTHPALLQMGQPTYYGELPCREALRRRGVPEQDLPRWTANSCMGLMIPGEEISDMWAAVVNAALALELASNDGRPYAGELLLCLPEPDCGSIDSFDDLLARFLHYLNAMLDWAVARNAAGTAWIAEHWPNPFLSALTGDCLARGLDRAGGGARYHTVTVEIMGLANAVDALTAIRRLVFEQQRYTLAELVAAAWEDFAGREDLREELLAQPKYGNGDAGVDELFREMAEHFAQRVRAHSTGNRHYGPSFHTLNAHIWAGAGMAAGLDGRRAGKPLAKNVGTTPGLAREGHTKLVLSATRFDQRDFFGGQALDLSLPAATLGPMDDRRKFQALLLTYFERGGLEVQVNGVTADDLRAAIADPDAHRDLTVRIAGYSARFTGLSPAVQQEMVARFEAGL